jgi:hypothetical protein
MGKGEWEGEEGKESSAVQFCGLPSLTLRAVVYQRRVYFVVRGLGWAAFGAEGFSDN